MAIKFTFLFCAFFLVSAFAIPSPTEVADTSLIDIIIKLTHALEKLIDFVITKVTEIINGISDNWESYQKKVVNITKTVITKVLQKSKPILDKIAESSTDAGKKMATCIESAEADIVSVPISFFDDVTKCFGSDLVKVVKSLGPLVKDLADIQEQVKEQADKIDVCKNSDAKGLECALKVALEVVQVVLQIPETVKPDIEPIKNDIKDLIKTVLKCVDDNVDPFYKNAGKVLDQIVTCAQ